MAKGAEQARAAVSAQKDRTDTKRKKTKVDTETSSDSDDERAAEKEAKKQRERERKRRLTDAEKTEEAKRQSILGKGQHPAGVALWWILGEMSFRFFKLNTLLHC